MKEDVPVYSASAVRAMELVFTPSLLHIYFNLSFYNYALILESRGSINITAYIG